MIGTIEYIAPEVLHKSIALNLTCIVWDYSFRYICSI